jgi:hypothetical protein
MRRRPFGTKGFPRRRIPKNSVKLENKRFSRTNGELLLLPARLGFNKTAKTFNFFKKKPGRDLFQKDRHKA